MNLKNFGIAFVMLSVLTACSDSVPSCGDSEVKDLVKEIAIDNLLLPEKDAYNESIAEMVRYIEQSEKEILKVIAEHDRNLNEEQASKQTYAAREIAEIKESSAQAVNSIKESKLIFKLEKEKYAPFSQSMKDFASVLEKYGVPESEYKKLINDKMLTSHYDDDAIFYIGADTKPCEDNNTSGCVEMVYKIGYVSFLEILRLIEKYSGKQIHGTKHTYAPEVTQQFVELYQVTYDWANYEGELWAAKNNIERQNKWLQKHSNKPLEITTRLETYMQDSNKQHQEWSSTRMEGHKKNMRRFRAQLESVKSALQTLDDGEFAIDVVRTTDINETTGENKCVAELKFASDDEYVKGTVRYTVQNTDDGDVYVEANLPSLF